MGQGRSYDRQGRRSQVLRDGITTTLSYDDANEARAESYHGGLLDNLYVSWTYSNSLQRGSLSLGGITGTYSVGYGYDSAGRLQAVNSGDNGAVYSYLANSPLVSQVVLTNSGTTNMATTRQYDHLNRLLSVFSAPSAASALRFAYSYNSANQRIRSTQADGSYWIYSYDALGQVTSGKRFWQDGTPVAGQQYEYAFDDIGNRKTTGAGGDATWGPLRQASYTPNRLNQYTQRDVPAAVDVLGIANPTASVTVNDNTAYRKGEYFDYTLSTPNANSPWFGMVTVHSAYGAGQAETGTLFVARSPEQFTHDADGNLTSDGRWNYTWDAENRLITMEALSSVPDSARLKLAFGYDFMGRRIKKWTFGWDGGDYVLLARTKFVYDGWNLLAELDNGGSIMRSFVWGLDLSGSVQGAGGVGGLLFICDVPSAIGDCAPAYDGNGNVAALVSMSGGTNCATYEYGPFGEVIRATGPMARANPFRFSTKYQDDETELAYYGYRYCSASTGRWLSRDLIEERGGVSIYVFSRNQPVGMIDALGKECVDPCAQFLRTDKNLTGAVICCEGRKYLCVWGPFPGITNSKAAGVVEKCLLDHENSHAYDVKDCSKCRKDIYRPGFKWWHSQPASECKAWTAEYNCLLSRLVDCGSDSGCRLEVMGWANNVYRI